MMKARLCALVSVLICKADVCLIVEPISGCVALPSRVGLEVGFSPGPPTLGMYSWK